MVVNTFMCPPNKPTHLSKSYASKTSNAKARHPLWLAPMTFKSQKGESFVARKTGFKNPAAEKFASLCQQQGYLTGGFAENLFLFLLWKALSKEELCLCWGKVIVNLGRWMCLSLRIQTPTTTGTGVVPSMMGTTDRGSAWLRSLFFQEQQTRDDKEWFCTPSRPRAADA